MIVISRRISQAIQIGDDIVLHIVKVSNDRVVLGIEYPDGASIRRAEIPAPTSIESPQEPLEAATKPDLPSRRS